MRFVAGFRHANQFRKALVDALDGYGFLMSYMPDESESPSAPIDYPTALARYYELLAAGPPRDTFAQEELQRARAEVDRRLQEQLIEPIRSAALEEHDLLQRALLMSLAEVNNIFHAQSLSLSEMARRDNSRSTPQSTKELTKTLLALSDRIANMTRAARQFSESRGAIVPLRRAKSPTSQPLRRWG